MTPEERAADVIPYAEEGSGMGLVRLAVAAAIRAAVAERDFEWWQACALVDNVAPTPEAVRDWIATVNDYHVKQAVAEEREACAAEAETERRDVPQPGVSYRDGSQFHALRSPTTCRAIAAAIRARK